MYNPDDQYYYVARSEISLDMARRAASPAVAAIHAELASRYNSLAMQVAEKTDESNGGGNNWRSGDPA